MDQKPPALMDNIGAVQIHQRVLQGEIIVYGNLRLPEVRGDPDPVIRPPEEYLFLLH
ncbi:hypothetical protein D3C71_2127420 [compost metagenome]